MDYYYQAEQKAQKKEKEPNTKLIVYLGELPYDTDSCELDQFITQQGNFKIDSLYVRNRGNKSFAYVKFRTPHEASRAIKALHLKPFKDCLIKAEPFKKNSQTDKTKNDSNLFIKNLPFDTTTNELYDLFLPFGNIISVNLRKDHQGKCMGYGYVNFDTEKSAKDAIEKLNQYNFKGNLINVSIFTPKAKRIEGNSEYLEPMLLVKKLPPEITTENQLIEIFEVYGTIILSGIIEENVTGKMGVIVFSKREEAEAAVSALGDNSKYEFTITPADNDLIEKIKKSKQEILKKKYEGCNLVIKNLPKEILDQQLFKLFSKFGEVASARVQTEGKMKEIKNDEGEVIDKEFVYESKRIGFVLFRHAEEAEKAKQVLNETETSFNGIAMKLSVDYYDYNKGEKKKIDEMKQNMSNHHPSKNKPRPMGNPHFPMGMPQNMNKNYKYNKNNPNLPENMQRFPGMINSNMPGFQIPTMTNMNFPQNNFMNQNMMNLQPPSNEKKITIESENLVEKVKLVLQIKNEDEKTECLGESLFYFLKEFIPQYKLNITGGKCSDAELCSKLTGILIKTDETNLLEIISDNDRLYGSLKEVIEKMLSSNKLG